MGKRVEMQTRLTLSMFSREMAMSEREEKGCAAAAAAAAASSILDLEILEETWRKDFLLLMISQDS